ncbi:5'-nucleotidase [Pseudoalteromonas luteoviolacea B = ATCC 29581]|nr:5'-nucleotidase [Pseudoalteromonas luteoviolacea B = ATCC 29581]
MDDGNFELVLSSGSTEVEFTLKGNASSSLDATVDQQIVSKIYTITPETVTLLRSVRITIVINTTQYTNGKLFIARKKDGIWFPVDSQVSDTRISADIVEFGQFAVFYQEKQSIAVSKIIGPACTNGATEQTVRFIHVADLHSRFGYREQWFSKIRGYYLQAQAEEPFTLFTNGGDDYEKGTVAEQISEGLATVEAIKAMKFDVRVVGNHDYAWGPSQLLNYANDDNAIVLASNTKYVGNESNGFAAVDFAAVQVGCIKVGFFGMTSVPWNELDEPIETPPIPDFIPNFKMNWDWSAVAQTLVDTYRHDVDYLVMLSHLGFSGDNRIAENIDGVDLVLGGHSHGGERINQIENGALVIQPNFFAQGLTDLTLRFNTQSKALIDYKYETKLSSRLDYVDPVMALKIDEIMGKYAPDSNTAIAFSENYPTESQLSTIIGHAAIHTHQVDAAFINPLQVQDRWLPGKITQEVLHEVYYAERQPSNTPGFNSLYSVSVTGSNLKQMQLIQPSWPLIKADDAPINDEQVYRVAFHKSSALNPERFFSAVLYTDPIALSESWWSLDQYARHRTSQCLHIDTETILDACKPDEYVTIWNFNDLTSPFHKDVGPSELAFFDPDNDEWWVEDSQFEMASKLNLPLINSEDSGVLAFPRHSPLQGLLLTHHVPANGDYSTQGKVSDYTVVMDILWPEQSTNEFRALLQTNVSNLDDADLYVDRESNGVGITTRDSAYYGSLKANTWYRIAFVFYAAPEQGALKVFINGELVGEKDEGQINDRWALTQQLLLLTDDSYETKPGYLNALLFAGRSFSEDEIAELGGPSAVMRFNQTIRTINQKVERHAKSVSEIKLNPWLMQRQKFFNKTK